MGLQWRIDGMEIPNPNHFAAVGTTGGPVTVLNNNLLAQSDFLTGSFPAQYGNALAGVFDMKMKVGNPEKHEYWFQVGWNGIEFGTEGPFSNKSQASYLFSYRYSLLDALSIFPVNFNEIPKYQDINLKINLPTKKAGTFSLFGLGGISYIELYDSEKPQGEWTFPTYGENIGTGSNLGVLGLTQHLLLRPSTRLKSMVYVVGSKVYTKIDTFTILARDLSPWAGERSTEVKYSGSLQLTHKFSAKNTVDLGRAFRFLQHEFQRQRHLAGKFQGQYRCRSHHVFLARDLPNGTINFPTIFPSQPGCSVPGSPCSHPIPSNPGWGSTGISAHTSQSTSEPASTARCSPG